MFADGKCWSRWLIGQAALLSVDKAPPGAIVVGCPFRRSMLDRGPNPVAPSHLSLLSYDNRDWPPPPPPLGPFLKKNQGENDRSGSRSEGLTRVVRSHKPPIPGEGIATTRPRFFFRGGDSQKKPDHTQKENVEAGGDGHRRIPDRLILEYDIPSTNVHDTPPWLLPRPCPPAQSYMHTQPQPHTIFFCKNPSMHFF